MSRQSRREAPQVTSVQEDNPLADARLPEVLPRWLSVNQIRKMQRCRKEKVLDAMRSGELPFEQRGRIRYARLSDVIAWEERRVAGERPVLEGLVHPDLADLA